MGKEVLAGAVLDLHLQDPEATIPPLPVVHPGAEAAIKQAVALIESSPEVRERVVRFMYHRGFMDGALDMAKVGAPPFSASVPRFERQRAIEREIVAFSPDPVEAMELLHSISRALTDRYGEDRAKDVAECIGEVEDALCELENTLAAPDPADASSGRVARETERAQR